MMKDTKCTGWWQQGGRREPMEALRMYVGEGKISGSGIDCVGPFTFDGILTEDNLVRMTKYYLGAHTVAYEGKYNGSNRLWGSWKILWTTGPWEITINSESEEKEQQQEVAKIKR